MSAWDARPAGKGKVRVVLDLADGRVLVRGSHRWPWPATVETVLYGLADRYDERLVVIDGFPATP